MASYKDIDWAGPMPACQHHQILPGYKPCVKPGIYDAPTKYGTQWANLCQEHEKLHANPKSGAGFRRRAT